MLLLCSSCRSGTQLLEKELPGELRQKVSNLQGSLQGVLGENVDAEEEDGPPLLAGVFQLTGTSFLLTWNVGIPEDPHAEWAHFLAWRRGQAVGQLASVRFSATMEESVQSDEAGRVHIHEQREVCKRLTRVSLEAFRYTTLTGVAVMPNCAPNYLEAVGSSSDSAQGKGRGAAYRVACDRAHFYVQANKFGTLFTETDWPMQKNFRVQAKWFDDLVARAKLSRDQWLQYAFDSTVGFSTRKRNFDALESFEKDQAIATDAAALRKKIAETCPKRPWKADLLQRAQAAETKQFFR